MFVLNDDTIDMAIDNICGYIVELVASKTGKTIEEVAEAFLSSETYLLLSNKETGYYWDCMGDLVDKFTAEIAKPDPA